MKLLFLLTCSVLITSCTQENPLYEPDTGVPPERVEICHNPESKSHREECTNDCFVPSLGNYSFCWTLWYSDCIKPLTHEWQKQNCHFFD